MNPAPLVATYFFVLIGSHLWSSTFAVYALTVVGLNGFQLSVLYSVSSIPGLLAIFAVPFYHYFRPHWLLGALCLLNAIALTQYASADTWIGLGLAVIAVSSAQAFVYPTASGMCLSMAKSRVVAQRSLAKLRSLGPVAALLASLAVIYLVPSFSYQFVFLIFALAIGLCGAFIAFGGGKLR